MYLSLVKNTYQMIHVPRYESYKEFYDDYDDSITVFFSTIEELDPDLLHLFTNTIFTDESHDADEYQQKKFRELAEDVLDGSNRNFYYPMDQVQIDETLNSKSDALLFDFIKKFINRLSIGFVHIEVSSIILDALLTKKYKCKSDKYLIRALAVVVVLLKDHGIKEAKSAIDVIRVIEKKGHSEIFEYEFYKFFKGIHMD